MLLRDDHKMTLSILMNVLVIDFITNTSASYRNFSSWLRSRDRQWTDLQGGELGGLAGQRITLHRKNSILYHSDHAE